jgi:hypothetical protein
MALVSLVLLSSVYSSTGSFAEAQQENALNDASLQTLANFLLASSPGLSRVHAPKSRRHGLPKMPMTIDNLEMMRFRETYSQMLEAQWNGLSDECELLMIGLKEDASRDVHTKLFFNRSEAKILEGEEGYFNEWTDFEKKLPEIEPIKSVSPLQTEDEFILFVDVTDQNAGEEAAIKLLAERAAMTEEELRPILFFNRGKDVDKWLIDQAYNYGVRERIYGSVGQGR